MRGANTGQKKAMIAPHLGEAFDTILAIDHAATRTNLVELVTSWAGRYGFGHFVVTRAASLPGEEPIAQIDVLASKLPEPLAARYERDRLWATDPMLRRAFDERHPIVTSVVQPRDLTPAERDVVGDFLAAGLPRGIVVPVLWSGRVVGTVGFFGEGAEDDPRTQAAMALTAPAILRRALVLGPDNGEDRRPGSRPTARELECLQLSAAGKSSFEIAQALVLSEHTVNTHLRSAIDKLKAQSRVQAVAEALRRGLIH